ncbi:hypothetical protein J5N97_012827 [Dioscorea zingiberensis]|uniref:HMA domain-containing protein n=1 Tax=Dioscorea zingiberensis TaxID=325984 RepID=A0A9D5CPN9_9LILI|nr:hypothetical protein J5N97_012827 [Dioscorea zingiberensis]
MTIVEMCVHMDCDGCEKKIRRALLKLKGIDNIDIDMVTQKVTVTGWVDQKKVLKAVRKTGRRAVLWPYPHNAEYQYYYYEHHPTIVTTAGYARQHPAVAPASSSYNYYKHGYNDSSMDEYNQRLDYSTSFIDEKARTMFSDENTNACSIITIQIEFQKPKQSNAQVSLSKKHILHGAIVHAKKATSRFEAYQAWNT